MKYVIITIILVFLYCGHYPELSSIWGTNVTGVYFQGGSSSAQGVSGKDQLHYRCQVCNQSFAFMELMTILGLDVLKKKTFFYSCNRFDHTWLEHLIHLPSKELTQPWLSHYPELIGAGAVNGAYKCVVFENSAPKCLCWDWKRIHNYMSKFRYKSQRKWSSHDNWFFFWKLSKRNHEKKKWNKQMSFITTTKCF